MKDKLVPLLSEPKPPGVGYRQGVIVSWNPDDATNTVSVAGSVFTNLPILNTSEASLLTAGDVVGLISYGSSFAILGRLVIPGTADAVSSIQSITNRIQATSDLSYGTRNSTAFGDLTGSGVGPAVTIRIGASGRALVYWAAEIGEVVTTGNVIQYGYRITPHVGVQVSGANTMSPNDDISLDFNLEHPSPGFTGAALTSFWGQVGTFHLFSGLSIGNTTFTLKYRHDTIAPTGSGATSMFGTREIAVFAL